MTVNHLMSKKVTALTPALPATHWQTVATFDWRDPAKVYAQVDTSLSSAQVLALAKTLKVAKKVSVMGYTNASTNLAAGVCAGGWAVRFLRIGTTDDTGLQSQTVAVPPSQAGGQAPAHFATPHWLGTNPGGFHLQVRHLPGFFDSFKIATRYIKVEWHT